MSTTRKIAYNTGLQVIGKAGSLALSLLTVGIMTRYLGTTGFGQYTTTIAYLQFFGIIVDFGLAVVVAQLIAARRAETDRILSNVFTFRLVTAAILFALAPIVVWWLPYPLIVKQATALAAGALFFVSLQQVIVSIYQRELQMFAPAAAEVAGRAAIFIGTIVVVILGADLQAIMAAVLIGNVLQFAVSFVAARRFATIRLACDWVMWREVLAKSWPIGLSIIFNLIYFRADTIILSFYRDSATVGLYGAPYKVLEVLVTFPYLFMGLVLPMLSASWAAGDRTRFTSQLQRAWDTMAIITWPVLIGGVVLATPIMVAVAGVEFITSGAILPILLVATAAIYFSNVFTHAIIAVEQQRRMLGGFAAVAVVALIGYLVLIPRIGYWGAAGVTVFAEVAILLISILVVRQTTAVKIRWSIFSRAAGAAVIMGAVVWLAGQSINASSGWQLSAIILLGAGVYIAALWLLGGLDKKIVTEVLGRD